VATSEPAPERTLGVDLASKPARTAVCLISWHREEAIVEQLRAGVDDAELVRLFDLADRVGIDVPFGWPEAFVRAVVAHRERRGWPAASAEELRYRRTDVFVWRRTGRPPLSVSSDRLAVPAFRLGRLLAGRDADRIGDGRYVEVYPRAARDRWSLGRRRVADLLERVPRLMLEPDHSTRCDGDSDCFDALIAALVTRAHALGECEPIPDEDNEAARYEGWIALPREGSLERLLG
jgi:predicted nuclease with RNAse H fold